MIAASPPVVEHNELIRHWDAGCLKIANCADNVRCFHVPTRVVVPAHHENPGVVSSRFDDQFVQILKIVEIAGQKSAIFPDGILEMNRIFFAR